MKTHIQLLLLAIGISITGYSQEDSASSPPNPAHKLPKKEKRKYIRLVRGKADKLQKFKPGDTANISSLPKANQLALRYAITQLGKKCGDGICELPETELTCPIARGGDLRSLRFMRG